MSKNTITVIVPVYNVEKYLARCIDSILAQTYTNFELILVDDGSPDNCGKICDEYAEKDSRIHVIHQENGGLSAARNAGIDWAFANSDSEWLHFVDSDDWIHPRMLEVLLDGALEHDCAISMCRFVQTKGEIDEIESIPPSAKISPENVWITEKIPTVACAKLYKKTCFEAIRYPVGKLHEDEFITYRLLFAQTHLALVPAELYYYFQNDAGIMRSDWSPKRLDALSALEEQISFFRGRCDLAFRQSCNSYFFVLVGSFLKAQSYTGSDKDAILKLLRKKLRRAIRKYKKELNYSMETDDWKITIAYPLEVKVYSYIRAAKNKLAHLFGGKTKKQ